ncbi:MAG: hypothetical protein ABI638_04360 [Ignavibacteriota bacterium]
MYSPKIKEQHVRALYLLKQQVKKPITHLANEAIEQYLKNLSKELIQTKENDNERK